MTKKQQQEEIDYWTREKPKLENAQRTHGTVSIPWNDNEYERIIEDVRQRFREPPAQAMPLLTGDFWYTDEQVVTGLVLEASWLLDDELYYTVRHKIHLLDEHLAIAQFYEHFRLNSKASHGFLGKRREDT